MWADASDQQSPDIVDSAACHDRAVYLRTGAAGLKGNPFSWKALKKLVREEIGWAVFFLLLSVPALICFGDTLRFAARGLISAVISFGGGDAYLAVANGMFVNTGMISHDDFYFQIASVANGLPGSILCKILAGVGYILGYQDGGVWCGYFVHCADLPAVLQLPEVLFPQWYISMNEF